MRRSGGSTIPIYNPDLRARKDGFYTDGTMKHPTKHPKSLFAQCQRALFVASLTFGFYRQLASAEWIQTMDTGVYQDSSGKVKIIVGQKAGNQGVFVLSGPSVPVQLFNIEQTAPQNSSHVFIRFDDSAQPPVYSEVVVGKRSYKISGNLTLRLDAFTTVGIDNNNPYLTVVSDHETTAPSILGFSGLNEVVRGAGIAATILAANQLNPEVAKVIRPYSLNGDEIMVDDTKITSGRLGTFIKPESDCLKASAIVLNQPQLLEIRKAKEELQRGSLLEGFLKDNKRNNPLKGFLTLKSDASRAILLDVKTQTISSLSSIASGSSAQKICVLAPLPMS